VQSLLLTFDVDWAPDWAIEICAEMCVTNGWKATFFATHASSALDALKQSDTFEVGIHPNFLPGSTQGLTEKAILDQCLELVPDATSMRAHAFVSSNVLTTFIARNYPQIEVDSSIFLPFHSNLIPAERRFDGGDYHISILPTWLSDMASANYKDWSWEDLPPRMAGICVMNVHPIHVALNSKDANAYLELKSWMGERPLQMVSKSESDRFRNSGKGVATWLENVLCSRQCAEPGTITAHVKYWSKSSSKDRTDARK